jgi:hypothetical protein
MHSRCRVVATAALNWLGAPHKSQLSCSPSHSPACRTHKFANAANLFPRWSKSAGRQWTTHSEEKTCSYFYGGSDFCGNRVRACECYAGPRAREVPRARMGLVGALMDLIYQAKRK